MVSIGWLIWDQVHHIQLYDIAFSFEFINEICETWSASPKIAMTKLLDICTTACLNVEQEAKIIDPLHNIQCMDCLFSDQGCSSVQHSKRRVLIQGEGYFELQFLHALGNLLRGNHHTPVAFPLVGNGFVHQVELRFVEYVVLQLKNVNIGTVPILWIELIDLIGNAQWVENFASKRSSVAQHSNINILPPRRGKCNGVCMAEGNEVVSDFLFDRGRIVALALFTLLQEPCRMRDAPLELSVPSCDKQGSVCVLECDSDEWKIFPLISLPLLVDFSGQRF
mmetsp:Transcript_5999/g.22724  ORF Transcript_5999/g.22724 Transcript_5999/m.22724 type:complete len:280 (+) Transcript_5999:1309-2148(+)